MAPEIEVFRYLDPYMEQISIGSFGTVLDEPKGEILTPFIRNGYPCFWCPYTRITYPVHRAMAEAFLQKTLKPNTIIRTIDGDKGNITAKNLEIWMPYPPPFLRIDHDTGYRAEFESIGFLVNDLIEGTKGSIARSRAVQGIKASLRGLRTPVLGYHYFSKADDLPRYPDPWNHRPVEQIDFLGEVTRSFPDLPAALSALGVINDTHPAPYRRKKIRAGYAALEDKRKMIDGFRLRYSHESARRVRLSSLIKNDT